MTISSARPDYLQRYAMFVADRSNAARSANTRAAVALAAYHYSSIDLPVTVDASAVTDAALARSDGMIARVRRVAVAFTMADTRGHPVAVMDDQRFGRVYAGSPYSVFGKAVDTETVYEKGWRKPFEDTRKIGPVEVTSTFEAFAGAEVTRKGRFDLDGKGLDAGVEGSAFVGARLEADTSLEAGVLTARGHAEASVGAEASAAAHAKISLEEVHVDASGGAFVGARGALDGEVEAMGVGLKGAAEARAGIGGDFSGEGHLGWDKIEIEVSAGLAFGLGAGGSGGFSVNPKETVSDAMRIGTRVQSDAGSAAKVARAKTEDLINDGVDLGGDLYQTGRDVVDGGLDFVRNPLGNTTTFRFDPHVLGGRCNG
ncbi:MAG: hypothetical protein ABI239_06315 [Aquihabitans sp.]